MQDRLIPPQEGADQQSDSADPDDREASPAQSYWMDVLQRAFLLLSLYVLSIGPMYWRWYDGKFVAGSPVVAAFYEPLVIAANLIPPSGEWLDWYVDLWIG